MQWRSAFSLLVVPVLLVVLLASLLLTAPLRPASGQPRAAGRVAAARPLRSLLTKRSRSPQANRPAAVPRQGTKPTPLPTRPPVGSPPPGQGGPALVPKPPLIAEANPLLFGVNVVWGDDGGIDGWDRDKGEKARLLVARLKEAGVTNLRVHLRWADLEHAHGQMDWRKTDHWLRFLKAQGFVLLCLVDGTPDWANEPDPAVRQLFADRGAPEQYASLAPLPKFHADLGRFAQELGRRYKDIIHRWEFWSEPDGGGMPILVRDANGRPTDIRYNGDPALYTKLLLAFAQGLKHADPACLVGIGGLSLQRIDFLQSLYNLGAQKAFDALCLHPVQGTRPVAFAWIDACRGVLLAHGEDRKKIWLTEWGWNTYPGEPSGIPEGQQARYVRQAFVEMRHRPFIEQADFHTFNDWRTHEDDPLQLVGRGLVMQDLRAKPALRAFMAEARRLPALAPKFHRFAQAIALPDAPESETIHLDVQANEVIGVLPKLGGSVAIDLTGEDLTPAALLTRLREGAFVRLNPFSLPGVVTMAPDGTPVVRWERPDALIEAVIQAKADVILSVSPPEKLSEEAWTALLTALGRRYGGDAKRHVTRWELAASGEEIGRRYPPFAQTLRALSPAAPIGLNLSGGDLLSGVTRLAAACAQGGIGNTPCDSFSWRVTGDPVQTAQTVRQLRAALARSPALKGARLLPQLADEAAQQPQDSVAAAARLLALASRLVDYAPLDQPHAVINLLVALPTAFAPDGRPLPTAQAMALLARVAGTRLNALSDESGVRCLAVRQREGIALLIWREEAATPTGNLPVLLRLRNLAKTDLGGLRMTRFTADTPAGKRLPTTAAGAEPLVPVATADLPGGGSEGNAEIPLLLAPHAVTLIEVKPYRPPALEIALSAPRLTWTAGDALELNVNVRNTAKSPQPLNIELASNPAGLVTPALAHTAQGTLPPGQGRALRFLLKVPVVGHDREVFLNVRGDADSRAALMLRLATPLVAALDTPRLNVSAPSEHATARVRLINRGSLPMALRLRTPDGSSRPITLPGNGKPVLQSLEVAAPEADPGLYPVELAVEDADSVLTTLRLFIGVPVLCRYATQKPALNGDLTLWTQNAPLGMGRAEQVRDKEWRGPNDLSAVAYTQWDDQYFYFACAVTDDVFFQPYAAPELWRGDSVQFALSPDPGAPPDRIGYGPNDSEFGMALLNGSQPTLYRFAGPPRVAPGPVKNGQLFIQRDGTRVVYMCAIPWSELLPAAPKAGTLLGLSILVNDNDGQGRGTIEWGGGMAGDRRPGLFPPLRLVR